MYKLLLCWRYLRTRYLALACIISVMLGVATLIVVNSVMSGFSTKLKDRLHGLLSDVVVEAKSSEGMPTATQWIARIQSDSYLAEKIVALAPTLETFALLEFDVNGEPFTKYVRVVGVDPRRVKLGGGAAVSATVTSPRASCMARSKFTSVRSDSAQSAAGW